MRNKILTSVLLALSCLHIRIIKDAGELRCNAHDSTDPYDLFTDLFKKTNSSTPQINAIWRRFFDFTQVVCSKCARARLDCGCSRGMQNPPFQLLYEHTEFMIWAYGLSQESREDAPPVSCVLLDISQPTGIGNQLLSVINALLLSLIGRRALTVKFPDTQRYGIDPVFDFDANQTAACRACDHVEQIDLASAAGLSTAMCEDLQRVVDIEDCVRLTSSVQASTRALPPKLAQRRAHRHARTHARSCARLRVRVRG
jgi:hypothetical protein